MSSALISSGLLDDLDDLAGSSGDEGTLSPALHAATGGAAPRAATGVKRARGAIGETRAHDGDDAGRGSGDDEEVEEEEEEDDVEAGAAAAGVGANAAAGNSSARAKRARTAGKDDGDEGGNGVSDMDDDEDDVEGAQMAPDAELEEQLAAAATTASTRAGYRSVARVRATPRFQEHMARVEAALAVPPSEVVGLLEEWPEYKLIVTSNQLVAAMDDEVYALHRYIASRYAKKFPELESIVPSTLEYVRVIKMAANETDFTLLDLSSVLPSATIMVVNFAAYTTTGKPLPEDELADVLAACDEVLLLDHARAEALRFVASRMHAIAPNLSALLGSHVAAQLVGIAGGITALSRTPACNVQVFGKKKTALSGFSRMATTPHIGVVAECALVQAAPPELRRKAARVLSPKVVLAARVDCHRANNSGAVGAQYFEAVKAKIAKWQEPPPGKTKKPLPIPDERPTKRRGGRRMRKMKERLAPSDMRKQANRVSFGTSHEEYSDVVMGRDMGMLGSGLSGPMKLQRKEQKLVKKRQVKEAHTGTASSLGVTSLAFTPAQGMELANPAAQAERLRKANREFAGYFSTTGSFSTIPRS